MSTISVLPRKPHTAPPRSRRDKPVLQPMVKSGVIEISEKPHKEDKPAHQPTNETSASNRSVDQRKQNKKTRWCFYELHKKGSCSYGEKCTFSHNVPSNGPEIMKNWTKSQIKYINNDFPGLDAPGLTAVIDKLEINANRSKSKLQHFLVNVIKEMINKEGKAWTSHSHCQ